jgi:hypothetical protein
MDAPNNNEMDGIGYKHPCTLSTNDHVLKGGEVRYHTSKLILACAFSIMIGLGIQPLGIHFDNALNTRSKSHSQVFPIIMNAIGIPFCHSSNTITMYKVY